MKVAAIIPARYHSTRLPGKPLADIAGEPMIRWVYERTQRARLVDEVWVATDDERILKLVESFGGNSRMTSPEHQSGTDRLAEIAREMDWDLVVNVQGDEPLLDPAMVDAVVFCLQKNPSIYMSTLKREITTVDEILNPNVVKVVTDTNEYALYFSRSPLPYFHKIWKNTKSIDDGSLPLSIFKHIGLYAYRRDFLLHFAGLEPTPLEKIEHLEQLRVLENGYKIKVIITKKDSIGVDSPDDLERVRRIVKTKGLSCNFLKEEDLIGQA
ncbi:MAG: 3-deoxy-manno-octulosonate cytidylyltransferase [Deltaproteobacteria bacterium]|nr:3-deoxy-manno-octulosonate cytidylyltransferase [Deltaproteobacteria bacterium]